MIVISDDEQWDDETTQWDSNTTRYIDSLCRQVFDDMTSRRSITHSDPVDIENFLATKGNLVCECSAHIQPGETEAIAALLASERFKGMETIIMCVYSHIGMDIKDLQKMVDFVRNYIPPESEMRIGWIEDEQTDKNSVTVHLIAICSETVL